VDARNPLLFRTEDLERYVKEVDVEKRNLLLINKADLMTEEQRREWAEWFGERGIRFAFYSARLAKEALDALKEQEVEEEEVEDVEEERVEELEEDLDDLEIDIRSDSSDHEDDPEPEEEGDGDEDPRTRILTVHELQSLFLREAPTPKGHDPLHPTKLVVGLVGYPNVGKSSTINSLLGEKRVSVSSTPGKTKHFQTIHLPPPSNDDVPAVILCDCPGLVFPNFASTKADLVCNGILPIDQLREWTGPASLLSRRIPKEVFEQVYSFKVYSKDEMNVTGEELLISFASKQLPPHFLPFSGWSLIVLVARGFRKAGHQGNPDDARAARIMLKDFVNGKVIYCHPPPGHSPTEFNRGHYTPSPVTEKTLNPNAPVVEEEHASIDDGFFRDEMPRAMTKGGVFQGRNMQYGFQRSVGDDGRVLRGYGGAGEGAPGKKHFKGRGRK
jgi:large subunit GTPase 1